MRYSDIMVLTIRIVITDFDCMNSLTPSPTVAKLEFLKKKPQDLWKPRHYSITRGANLLLCSRCTVCYIVFRRPCSRMLRTGGGIRGILWKQIACKEVTKQTSKLRAQIAIIVTKRLLRISCIFSCITVTIHGCSVIGMSYRRLSQSDAVSFREIGAMMKPLRCFQTVPKIGLEGRYFPPENCDLTSGLRCINSSRLAVCERRSKKDESMQFKSHISKSQNCSRDMMAGTTRGRLFTRPRKTFTVRRVARRQEKSSIQDN